MAVRDRILRRDYHLLKLGGRASRTRIESHGHATTRRNDLEVEELLLLTGTR